ncbi:DNA-binding response regulator [Fulvitalea axinellae]|uniref:DNA-binding response regulator n=1 Tax=Fulvitalea axinellae TaxID=1182444 RepID=A0AAU9CTX9_9BACT|nr:DNA-binding response regulator [Fulvitalea axinellae]
MKKLTCLIIDDEYPARVLLAKFVEKFPSLELIGQCEGPLEAMEILAERSVDLIFLDIQMPDLTGIEMLRALSGHPAVIFTTAYPDYALDGYRFDTVDYLLKPFSFERFAESVNKAIKRLGTTSEATRKNLDDSIVVKSDSKFHIVKYKDIDYIEGLKAYVSFYVKGERIIALESLKSLVDQLPENNFMRIHKSYIVALDKVKAVEGNMLLVGDKKLPVGASFKETVMKRLLASG